jgi:hypothetical protein
MSVIFNQVRMILHENFSFSYDQIQLDHLLLLQLQVNLHNEKI